MKSLSTSAIVGLVFSIVVSLCAGPSHVGAFTTLSSLARIATTSTSSPRILVPSFQLAFASSNNDDELQKTFGGYTAKQRLREEVESPFRTARLFFFGASTGSALVALYFSIFAAIKATVGGFPDAPSLDEALTSCAINAGAAIACGWLTYRDWQAGNTNLERIAQGGKLAKLQVRPMTEDSAKVVALANYRRNARILVAAGGKDYIETLCRSLCADQKSDENTLARGLEASDVIVVPVLLLPPQNGNGEYGVGDTASTWLQSTPVEDQDRNWDVRRAERVVAFPRGAAAWAAYLRPELETAAVKQGFDVLSKGITIVVKKNGRILRRATGQPQFEGLIETMEVMDGSRFGMPGDDEKYGS